jgi:adenylosuccinate lyase
MIDRYKRDETNEIFSLKAHYEAMLEVELATLDAWVDLEVIPREDANLIRSKVSIDVDAILELEKETRHDVVAFTRYLTTLCGEEGKWIHYGLTSTDVVDTAKAIQYKRANLLIEEALLGLKEILRQQAIKYQFTPIIGRTHGIHAEVTSFGLKWALWYDELNRHIERFYHSKEQIEVGKISGAVGNFANTTSKLQDLTCSKLEINSANISTQVLQRDRHAELMSTMALIGSFLEKISIEIRHLQRTEVSEVQEAFRKGQKGSSAMPHKKNPIASENISGLSRVLRGYMLSSFEDMALWHERDISHSSVERVIIPDAYHLVFYMLKRYTNVLENLVVHEEKMLENIHLTHGVVFSQRVLNQLIETGVDRNKAYDHIQSLAFYAFETSTHFKELCQKDEWINNHLTSNQIDDCFDHEFFLKEVDSIFKRVGIYA